MSTPSRRLLALGETSDFFWRVTKGVLTGRVRRYFVEVLNQATLLATGSLFIVLAFPGFTWRYLMKHRH